MRKLSWKTTRRIIQSEVEKKRKKRGDLKRLLSAAGITYSTFYHHVYDAPAETETFDMSLDFLVGIASALGVSLTYLLTGEPNVTGGFVDESGSAKFFSDLLRGVSDSDLPDLYHRIEMVIDWYRMLVCICSITSAASRNGTNLVKNRVICCGMHCLLNESCFYNHHLRR